MQHSTLLLQLSPSSGEPIYKQLIEQIERMIASGQLGAGDYLPSVRQLANDLEVNPMTISKAYGLLESHGHLTRVRGKGMMIAELAHATSVQERLESLSPLAKSIVQQSKQLDLELSTVIKWLSDELQKEVK
jgi:GntR family transcriptional regulator